MSDQSNQFKEAFKRLDFLSGRQLVLGGMLAGVFTLAVLYHLFQVAYVESLPSIERGSHMSKAELLSSYGDIYSRGIDPTSKRDTYMGMDLSENENAVLMGNKSSQIFALWLKIIFFALIAF